MGKTVTIKLSETKKGVQVSVNLWDCDKYLLDAKFVTIGDAAEAAAMFINDKIGYDK